MFEPVKRKLIQYNLQRLGYSYFEDKFYNLNIVGIRETGQQVTNAFDDWIYVSFKDITSEWCDFWYRATTDPGAYWVSNPLTKDGTAILKEGQYKGVYTIGKHHGEYDALVQTGDLVVYRDRNKDSIYDFSNEQVGKFGVNIHCSSFKGGSSQVDKWSAGCQVFKHSEDFEHFMKLCYKQVELTGYRTFTYTLLNSKELQ